MRGITVKFGALNLPIKEQLRKQGFALNDDKDKFEKIRHAINMLRIHGITTDAEADRMYKRLLREVLDCTAESE